LQQNNIEEAQKVMLSLLEAFDLLCKKNRLAYWLDHGTLLGAVRHHGFIPWDDDLDVTMPRDDYEKFLEVAKQELPENIFLQTKISDPHTPVH
jgi:lipopolysaccharide cholinephosphotransferase